jgi:hypothetical protein
MALLPSLKRVNTKDFPAEDQKLIEQLGGIINDSIQPVYDALNQKLTFEQNFLGSIRDVEVTVNSNGVPVNSTVLNTGVVQAKGVIVLKATNLSNSAGFPTGAPFVSFNIVNNGIQIIHVTGLTAGNRYSLRLLTLG